MRWRWITMTFFAEIIKMIRFNTFISTFITFKHNFMPFFSFILNRLSLFRKASALSEFYWNRLEITKCTRFGFSTDENFCFRYFRNLFMNESVLMFWSDGLGFNRTPESMASKLISTNRNRYYTTIQFAQNTNWFC